jgi:hypothetical protein
MRVISEVGKCLLIVFPEEVLRESFACQTIR